MTLPVPIGPSLLVAGAVLSLAGLFANKYHSRRFAAHADELRRLAEAGEREAVADEVETFHEDRRIDMAIHLLTLEPVGWILLLMGVGWLYA